MPLAATGGLNPATVTAGTPGASCSLLTVSPSTLRHPQSTVGATATTSVSASWGASMSPSLTPIVRNYLKFKDVIRRRRYNSARRDPPRLDARSQVPRLHEMTKP